MDCSLDPPQRDAPSRSIPDPKKARRAESSVTADVNLTARPKRTRNPSARAIRSQVSEIDSAHFHDTFSELQIDDASAAYSPPKKKSARGDSTKKASVKRKSKKASSSARARRQRVSRRRRVSRTRARRARRRGRRPHPARPILRLLTWSKRWTSASHSRRGL